MIVSLKSKCIRSHGFDRLASCNRTDRRIIARDSVSSQNYSTSRKRLKNTDSKWSNLIASTAPVINGICLLTALNGPRWTVLKTQWTFTILLQSIVDLRIYNTCNKTYCTLHSSFLQSANFSRVTIGKSRYNFNFNLIIDKLKAQKETKKQKKRNLTQKKSHVKIFMPFH